MKAQICGIYVIEVISGNFEKIGWKYVGQSFDTTKRIKRHFYELKLGIHKNLKLQRFFNKYGKASLIAYQLMECIKSELDFWEKYWIKNLNTIEYGFNIVEGGKCSVRKKACTLQNIFTGQRITFPSCKEFAEAHDLNEHGVVYVLLGKNKTVGDWFNPKNKWKPVKYIIVSPENIQHEVLNFRIIDFCKKHRIKDTINFRQVLRKKRKSSHGWRLLNTNLARKGKKFIIKNSYGSIFEGNNIAEFARNHNINKNALQRVISGERKSCKGWILCRV